MQKRLNWSRCHLPNTLMSPRNNISDEMDIGITWRIWLNNLFMIAKLDGTEMNELVIKVVVLERSHVGQRNHVWVEIHMGATWHACSTVMWAVTTIILATCCNCNTKHIQCLSPITLYRPNFLQLLKNAWKLDIHCILRLNHAIWWLQKVRYYYYYIS